MTAETEMTGDARGGCIKPESPRQRHRASSPADRRRKPVPNRRLLLGTWKSDRRKTLATCHKYHEMTEPRKQRFAALFGKLQLRYTRRFVYHTLRKFKYRERYDVVAEDDTSLVIRVHTEGIKKRLPAVWPNLEEFFAPKLHQFHFVIRRRRPYYWIGQGHFCEWFRKVENAKKRR